MTGFCSGKTSHCKENEFSVAGTSTVHVGRPDGMIWPEFTDLAVSSLTDLDIYLP